jgi:uncharacterized protein (DUF885 family)
MKRVFAVILFFLPAAGLDDTLAQSAHAEETRLRSFFQAYLDELFRLRPMEATRLGDHRFDHLLDDVSPKARTDWVELTRKTLRDLPRRVAYGKLPRAAQVDFEIFEHSLKRDLWLAENTRPFEQDPRVYNDYITDSVYLLLTQSTQPMAVNVRNCVSRMANIPRVIAAARAALRDPPRVFVETALRQNRGAIAFYQGGIYDLSGETPQLSDLKQAARPVLAALKEYQKFLEDDLLPRAEGAWRLGKEKFAQKLHYELNAGIPAEEVVKEAESEAQRVENDMYVIARQLWAKTFPGKALPPDDTAGRRSTIRQVLEQVSREHGRVENLVRDARAGAERIKAFIRKHDILRLPEPDHCRILEMPEFQRGNTIAFLNPAPPLDAGASSYYAISPPPHDWDARRVETYLREYNRYMLQILTIHEAYPGHYVQLEYASRNPSLIRRVLYSGVFAEGWAVYTEQMMLDQGYGDGDLALRLNQLKWYLRTVANAILDYKMHCTNMTDEEALRFLMERAFQSEAEAILKIIRAKQTSCQLSTYFVGRMPFQRLRRRFQNELGTRFDLGRYHEAVLAHGTLPVHYLPELVRQRLTQPRGSQIGTNRLESKN